MDDEVQLTAIAPAPAAFAALGIISKHRMMVEAAVVTDRPG
jgi:hypothetical protein